MEQVPVQVKATDLKACDHCGNETYVEVAEGIVPTLKIRGEEGSFGTTTGDPLIAFACTNCGRVHLHVGQRLKIVAEEEKARADAKLAATTSELLDAQNEEQEAQRALIAKRDRIKQLEDEQKVAADAVQALEDEVGQSQ